MSGATGSILGGTQGVSPPVALEALKPSPPPFPTHCHVDVQLCLLLHLPDDSVYRLLHPEHKAPHQAPVLVKRLLLPLRGGKRGGLESEWTLVRCSGRQQLSGLMSKETGKSRLRLLSFSRGDNREKARVV